MNAPPSQAAPATAARFAPGVATFAAVAGLALSGGGYGAVASGTMTTLVWAALLIAAIALPGERRRVPLLVLGAAAALGLLAVMTAFSLGFTPDRGAAFEESVRLAGYAGVVVLVALRRREDAITMLAGVGAAIAFVALLAVCSRLLGLGTGDAELAIAYPGSAGRLSYPIGYWNGLGSLMALGVPILACLGASRGIAAKASAAAMVPVLLATYMTASRGGMVAALIGAATLLALARGRRRGALAVLVAGLLASVPAIASVQLGEGILTAPFTGFGGPEATAVAITSISISAAWVLALPIAGFLDRLVVSPRVVPFALAALAVCLLGSVVAVGPGRVVDEFTAISREDADSVGGEGRVVLSASGSGRAQFWDAALRAFASEPLRGIGAGGFESFWTREGDLEIVVRSVHSEPLELLAELGPLALLAFAAFFGLVIGSGIGWWRSQGRSLDRELVPEACLALIAAASIGLLIDWSWDLPAVAVVILTAAGILLSGRLGVTAELGGRAESLSVPSPLVAGLAIVLALPIIGAGFVAGVSAAQLGAAQAAYERGHLSDAVDSARTAARLQPWAAEPWERIAVAEQAADNDEAALRAAALAVERSPESFEPWGLMAKLSATVGAVDAARAYAQRGERLAPFVYSASFERDRGSIAER